MSIQDEINRIEQNIANTYSALNSMGATMPAEQNSNNIASTARTVPQSGGGGVGGTEYVSDVFYIDAVLNIQTFQAAGVSCTHAEALHELIDNNKIVKFRIIIPMGNQNIVYGDVVNLDANGNNALVGGITFRADFGQGINVYHFVAVFKYTGELIITPYIVNTISMI